MFVNKAGLKLRFSDIPISWLCPHCWGLIADYCRAAHVVDQVSLNPSSDRVLADIRLHSRSTKNPILRALFRDLKIGIRTILNQPEQENQIVLLLVQLAKNYPTPERHNGRELSATN